MTMICEESYCAGQAWVCIARPQGEVALAAAALATSSLERAVAAGARAEAAAERRRRCEEAAATLGGPLQRLEASAAGPDAPQRLLSQVCVPVRACVGKWVGGYWAAPVVCAVVASRSVSHCLLMQYGARPPSPSRALELPKLPRLLTCGIAGKTVCGGNWKMGAWSCWRLQAAGWYECACWT
jgi:hypothetical protein